MDDSNYLVRPRLNDYQSNILNTDNQLLIC